VLWRAVQRTDRGREQAQRSAVLAATAHLERTAAWRAVAGVAAPANTPPGLLMAQFDHHTSRESDPQLHTHCFIFNLAPRATELGRHRQPGALQKRKASRRVYRRRLANELERLGYRLDRQQDGFRVAAIPRAVERAFSKRRQRSRKPPVPWI